MAPDTADPFGLARRVVDAVEKLADVCARPPGPWKDDREQAKQELFDALTAEPTDEQLAAHRTAGRKENAHE